MNGSVWLALALLAAALRWIAWRSWSNWRKEVRAAKAAQRFARSFPRAETAGPVRTATGKHHVAEPADMPLWPPVDLDDPVEDVSPVRPYAQAVLPTSVMPRPVFVD